MGTIVVLLLFVFVAFLIVKGFGSGGEVDPSKRVKQSEDLRSEIEMTPDVVVSENRELLDRRWREAMRMREQKDPQVPKWYFDPLSDKQRTFAEKLGVSLQSNLTKKQASDIIGLLLEPNVEDIEVLKFFKIDPKGLNETTANDRVAMLLSDKAKLLSWQSRPASQMQKENLKFLGEPPKRGITMQEANELLARFRASESDEMQTKFDEWSYIENLFDDVNDADSRSDIGIKKLSFSLFREILDSLLSKGARLSDLSASEIHEAAIQAKPELKRVDSL